MKLIVGLGNPGKEYENTRHNVGFLVISKTKNQILKTQTKDLKINKKFNAEIIEIEYNNEKVLLVKPQTFMNNSGKAVKKIMDYYKIDIRDLYVICDDLDLELGQIRIRKDGSSGGHKGLQSIIEQIGSNKFVRFRIGIGSNKLDVRRQTSDDSNKIPAEKYVLQKFGKDEQKIINYAIDKTVELIVELLGKGVEEKTINIV